MDFLDTLSEILSYPSLDEAPSTVPGIKHREQQYERLTVVGTVPIDSGFRLSISLENQVVLEQFQDFYLLKNSQSDLFSIWAEAAEAPIFKSTNWSAAYRAWLNLRQAQKLGHSHVAQDVQSCDALHDWVRHHQDDPWFGQLMYSRDLTLGGVLQYSVQISETIALRWTEGVGAEGVLALEKVGRRQHRPAKWIESQPQAVIAAALHGAIDVFHQRWSYSLYRFNSEHWAKLIVTGQCGCDQTDEILDYWRQTAMSDEFGSALPEVLTLNLEAQSILNKAIADTVTPEPFTT
jgi:hypothetical protein